MRKTRPEKLTFAPRNETGFIVESSCRLPELKAYEENGTVLFWATVVDTKGEEHEALQYLTPEVAMKMAKSLECMAVHAFKNNA